MENFLLEVGVTVYFSNLFLKSSPLRGGTKRHVTAFSLQTNLVATQIHVLTHHLFVV